jgi:hypothetical protein
MRSAMSGAVRSVQPTTPAIRSLEAASASSSGVSPGTVTVCTTTLAATPFAAATDWYSPGGKSRRSGASAGPAIQSWSRTPRFHT